MLFEKWKFGVLKFYSFNNKPAHKQNATKITSNNTKITSNNINHNDDGEIDWNEILNEIGDGNTTFHENVNYVIRNSAQKHSNTL